MCQARAHNLLVQNRELLEHINALVRQLQELESRLTGADVEQYNLLKTPVHVRHQYLCFCRIVFVILRHLQRRHVHVCVHNQSFVKWWLACFAQAPFPEVTSPEPGPSFIPAVTELDLSTISNIQNSASSSSRHYVTASSGSQLIDSPDSGLREMSSDSLVYNVIPNDVTLRNSYVSNSSSSGSNSLYGGTNHSKNAAARNSASGAATAHASNGISGNPHHGIANESAFSHHQFSSTGQNVAHNPNTSHQSTPQNESNFSRNPFVNSSSIQSSTANRNDSDKENNNRPPSLNAYGYRPDFNSTSSRQQRSNQGQGVTLENGNQEAGDILATNGGGVNVIDTNANNDVIAMTANDNRPEVTTTSAAAAAPTTNVNKTRDPPEHDVATAAAVSEAKKEGVLKTLNLNLRSLRRSPNKRHSSTSADLYARKDAAINAAAKLAIQSSSESKLLRQRDGPGGGGAGATGVTTATASTSVK